MNHGMVDAKTLCRRLLRYLLLGLTIAFAQLVIPKRSVDISEVVAMAIIAAATFAVIDLFSGEESMGKDARTGAALVMGARVAGFPM